MMESQHSYKGMRRIVHIHNGSLTSHKVVLLSNAGCIMLGEHVLQITCGKQQAAPMGVILHSVCVQFLKRKLYSF